MKNYNPPKTATVCSKHFKEEDYKPCSVKKKLKANAIPYVRIKIIIFSMLFSYNKYFIL